MRELNWDFKRKGVTGAQKRQCIRFEAPIGSSEPKGQEKGAY